MGSSRCYRNESIRLQAWDYAHPGAYFVTICTRDRKPYFGQVIDYMMHPSPAGIIVADEWRRTAEVRESVELDAWVVMPNHFHGILLINADPERPFDLDPDCRWGSTTLGAIINQLKGVCTRRIRLEYDASFAWQSRYYEHIIRNDRSLDRIRAYIDGNPATWHDDQLFINDVTP